ncbi:hypothetical protein WJR50_18820 [Catalinimonas sp. 4WD22]|uniref:hypothetical protein n=1 Tax=Catalinimonas locisalis TaxID=3133978 RepID=UPI003100AFE7
MNKNIVEIEVGDKKIGFKFCFASYSIFCDMHDVDLKELISYLKNLDLNKIRDLLYSGHVAYCKSKGIECEATPESVEDWIDEIGLLSDSYKSIMDAWNHAFTSLFFGSNTVTVSEEGSKKKRVKKKDTQ